MKVHEQEVLQPIILLNPIKVALSDNPNVLRTTGARTTQGKVVLLLGSLSVPRIQLSLKVKLQILWK